MGLESNSLGDSPKIALTAFVHHTATLIGNVSVEDGAFVGPHAVLRADEPGSDGTVQPVIVCKEANVQDCAVVHALGGTGVKIGPRSSVAHAAVVHGPCQIGEDCFIGFNSVVFNATLDVGAIVMHQALVEGVTIPSGFHVPSMTAVRDEADVRRLAPATQEMVAFADKVYRTNVLFATEANRGQPSAAD